MNQYDNRSQYERDNHDRAREKYNLPPIGRAAYEYNNPNQYKQRDHSSGSRLRSNALNIINAGRNVVASAQRLPSYEPGQDRHLYNPRPVGTPAHGGGYGQQPQPILYQKK